MLDVTEAAATLLKGMISEAGAPQEAGIRIEPRGSQNGQDLIGLALTETPAPADQVIERHDLKIFVAPELAEAFDDRTLDVEQAQEGVSLTLR